MKSIEELKKQVQDNVNVNKSNGNIYHSCPYIDKLIKYFETDKHKDKSKEWWWGTHGIDIELTS